jgi:hypothetical protein
VLGSRGQHRRAVPTVFAEQRPDFGAVRIPVRAANHFGIDCERRRRIEVPDLV